MSDPLGRPDELPREGASQPPEAALFDNFIRRIRAGDERAAEELVRRFEPLIRRAVRVRIKSRHLNRVFDSMDVCQSVLASFFVRAASGAYDLEQPEQLVGLLVKMASNKLASRSRGELRQRRDIRRLDDLGALELQRIQDARPAPSALLAGRELLEQFRANLTEEERQLATLRSEGLDWSEVAQRVGGKAHARRVQLARGVERVTQQLGLDREDVRLVSIQRT